MFDARPADAAGAGGAAEAAVRRGSRSLGRLLDADPAAAAVLEDLDVPPASSATTADDLVRWKRHELLRIGQPVARVEHFEFIH